MEKIMSTSETNDNFCEIGERFSQIKAQFFEHSNRKFAQKIGVDERGLSSICNGKRNPGKEIMEKVLNSCPEVSRAWLYFGTGTMIESVQKEDVKNDAPTISNIGNGNNNSIHSGSSVDAIIRLYEGRLMDKDEQIKLLKDSVRHLAQEIEELRSWTKLCADRYLTNMDSIKDVTEDTNEIVRDCRKHIGYIQEKEEKK